MLTRDDRAILRNVFADGEKTTSDVKPHGWGEGAWNKLTECKRLGYADRVGEPQPPFTNPDEIRWRLSERGRTWLAENEPGAASDRFLRYGGWCECECSCNVDTGAMELGVSVYECYADGPRWYPVLCRALEKNEVTLKGAPWFLVSGTAQAGVRGGDGEPLLKDVAIVLGLQWDPVATCFAEFAAVAHRRNHSGRGTAAGCQCTKR